MKYLLISFNVICAVIHLFLGAYIYDKPIEYVGFISIENTLVIFMYLLLSFLLCTQREKEGILINLFFWCIFEICILVFRPIKTTLEIFDMYFPISQWQILSGVGGVVILFNCLVYANKEITLFNDSHKLK